MQKHVALQAAHYNETEEAMAEDPIVVGMFLELPEAIKRQLAAREFISGFMTQAMNEHKARGGEPRGHIGAVEGGLQILAERWVANDAS